MRYVIILPVLFASLAGMAQEGFDAAANFSGAETHMFRSFDNRYQGVKGYPTFLEEFIEGEVELKNGAKATRVDINLDIVTGELLLKSRTMDKIMVVKTSQVKSIAMIDIVAGNKVFHNVLGLGFCEQLYAGNFTIYLKHIKYIEKANYGGAYNANARQYDEFVAADKYYLVIAGSQPEETKLNRKALEKSFPAQADQIHDYFKKEKPDLENPAEVGRLFAFIDKAKS